MVSAPLITNLSVRPLAGGPQAGLIESAIDVPQDDGSSESWALRICGYVVGATGPVRLVEAVVPGLDLGSAEPNLPTPDVGARHQDRPWAAACGFTLLVDTLGLRQNLEMQVRATLEDGARVPFACIAGQRRLLATGYSPRLQPLLVNTFGRTGSTMLMRMLAAHPAVIVYDRPPYEVRPAKYWMHLLATVAAPADASKRIGAAMEFHREPLAVGGNPFVSAAFAAWPQVEAWAGSAYVEQLAAFCQRGIDGFYLATAQAQGQAEAPLVYFAEKHFPDAYPRRLRELYPQARELFLVRDFRDMVASMRAYNDRKGSGDFGRDDAGSDEAWLAYLRTNFLVLRNAWRDRGAPGSLVRYEDLIRDPAASLTALLLSLGLDASPVIVAAMIAAADAPDLRGHGTAASPDASIGRWRTDLPPELHASVERTFADLLRDFGYQTDATFRR